MCGWSKDQQHTDWVTKRLDKTQEITMKFLVVQSLVVQRKEAIRPGKLFKCNQRGHYARNWVDKNLCAKEKKLEACLFRRKKSMVNQYR